MPVSVFSLAGFFWVCVRDQLGVVSLVNKGGHGEKSRLLPIRPRVLAICEAGKASSDEPSRTPLLNALAKGFLLTQQRIRIIRNARILVVSGAALAAMILREL